MLLLTDFFSIDELDNIPGYSRYWFIADDSVLSIPRHVNGIIDFEGITYKPGKDYWYSGGALFNNLDLGEKEEKTNVGSIYPIDITGTTAGLKPNVISLFHTKRNARFILIIGDNNGNYFIVGEPNNGLKFSYNRNSNSINFTYKGGYKLPAFFLSNYQGSTPSPGGGGSVGGGEVVIKRTGGTSIATVTAPAEYTVADTVVRLRDSVGNQLSIHNIKAADGNIDLPAPDAVAVVRNTATTILITENIRASQTEQITVADTKLNLVNSNNDIIDVFDVSSGVNHNINIPDTVIKLKDTSGYDIAIIDVASGSNSSITAPDANVKLNDNNWLNIKSAEIININLVNENEDVITPLEITSNTIKIEQNTSSVSIFNYANSQ